MDIKPIKSRDSQKSKCAEMNSLISCVLGDKMIVNRKLSFWEDYVKDIIKEDWFPSCYFTVFVDSKKAKKHELGCINTSYIGQESRIYLPNSKQSRNELVVIHELSHLMVDEIFVRCYPIPKCFHTNFSSHGSLFCGCLFFLYRKIKGKKCSDILKRIWMRHLKGNCVDVKSFEHVVAELEKMIQLENKEKRNDIKIWIKSLKN